MNTKISSSQPIPGLKSGLNAAWVIEQVAFWLFLANIVATLAFGLVLRGDFNPIVFVYIAYVLVTAVACVRTPALKHRTTMTSWALSDDPTFDETVAATLAATDLPPDASHAVPVKLADGGTITRASITDPDMIGRLVDTIDSRYPIPPSIARALGPQATAQIEKSTKEAGL